MLVIPASRSTTAELVKREASAFFQSAEKQRHWIPDIASRFRNDKQNQRFD
jgi:hypothetical protein